MDWYVLKNKIPLKVGSIEELIASPYKNDRVVKQEYIDDIYVSTVFLGLNHNWDIEGPPILFETMIFGGEHDQYQDRYTTWEEAEEGHKKAIKLVTDGKTEDN